MRWLINFFRAKTLGRSDGALSPKDMQQWEKFNSDAKIMMIKQLEKLSEDHLTQSQSCLDEPEKTSFLKESKQLKQQADDLVALSHRAYWGCKESAQRYDADLQKHYKSFYQDPRVSTTFTFIAVLALIQAAIQFGQAQPYQNSRSLISTLAPLVGILLLIQSIHHQNYKNEAKQLASTQKFYFHQSKQNGDILIKTGNAELCDTEPCYETANLTAR